MSANILHVPSLGTRERSHSENTLALAENLGLIPIIHMVARDIYSRSSGAIQHTAPTSTDTRAPAVLKVLETSNRINTRKIKTKEFLITLLKEREIILKMRSRKVQ